MEDRPFTPQADVDPMPKSIARYSWLERVVPTQFERAVPDRESGRGEGVIVWMEPRSRGSIRPQFASMR
jgi:hypothetical protein